MQLLRGKLVGLGMAGGMAVLMLAGAPATASTQVSRSITGPEVVSGAAHGKAALANSPHIPLTLRGVVNTSDPTFVLGNGKGRRHALFTRAGKLAVVLSSKSTSISTANPRTCRETFVQDSAFAVVGSRSTGAFAGASGNGGLQITFAATAQRFKSGSKKGQCNFNGTPRARGAVARFLAAIVLTVR